MAVVVPRNIGDTFNYIGEEYQVIESKNENCSQCEFNGHCHSQNLNLGPCVIGAPFNFKFINFKKVRKL